MVKYSDFLLSRKPIGSDESIEKYIEDKRKKMEMEEESECGGENALLARIPTPSLEVKIGSLTLKNPLTAAAGCFGYGIEYKDYQKLSELGAIFSNGTTLKPCHGAAQPRTVENVASLLQNNGYENPGIEAVKKDILPQIEAEEAQLIINICGESAAEMAAVAAALEGCSGVAGVELNLSCLDAAAGRPFALDAEATGKAVAAVRAATSLPLIAKLSADVSDIAAVALAAEKAGADAVSVSNAIRGLNIDVAEARPKLAAVEGGLCGPVIKPIALRAVWETYKAVSIPIIGCGGIFSAFDALEFLLAGASAVQIGSANFVYPDCYASILSNIIVYMKMNGMTRMSKLTGFAHRAAEE